MGVKMNKKNKTSKLGTKPDEIRATFILNENQLGNIKLLAYFYRKSIKDIIYLALDEYLSNKKLDIEEAQSTYDKKHENKIKLIVESFIQAIKNNDKNKLEQAVQYFKDKIDTINEQK